MSSYKTALAIIGMAGRFPGAEDVRQFWANIAGGVRSIRPLTEAELDPALLHDPGYVRFAATLENFDCFDAAFFGYSPREAEIMDPQHRVFLECAWSALEDAGYPPESHAGQIGIFAGAGVSGYAFNNILPRKDVIEAAGMLQVTMNNEPDSLVTRVAYRLNLRGPTVAVQTFCSSSMVAVHLACQSLLTYECNAAVAGGAAIPMSYHRGYIYREGGILSPDGHCRSFDARAQGSVMGSGAGAVVLKRAEEALADGDHIYALILGSALNNDGIHKVGFTAPGLAGEAAVIATAHARADVKPESIGYVEAHGTGTPLGDSIELDAMIRTFRRAGTGTGYCAIGSVKPNIGHLDRASGAAGLIKTALALHHRQLPPSLDFENPSPDLELDKSAFYVNTALREWPRNGSPRRAGVSSFGLGGTNVHIVLEEAPSDATSSSPLKEEEQLLLLSAKSLAALTAMTENLAIHLTRHSELHLADVAYTLQAGRSHFNHRRYIVCSSLTEAAAMLRSALHSPVEQNLRRSVVMRVSDEQAAAELARSLEDCGVRPQGDLVADPVIIDSMPVGRSGFLHLLGGLWLKGVSIQQAGGRRVSLPTYPFERTRYWVEPAATESADEERRPDIADWFFVHSWRRSPVLQDVPCSPQRWLVFLDNCGVGQGLCDSLRKEGHIVATVRREGVFECLADGSYTVPASSRADFELLLEALRGQHGLPERVVHTWLVEDEPALERQLDLGFYSLLALTQALGDSGMEDCRISVISQGVHDVVPSDCLEPGKATAVGACKGIAQEYLNVSSQNIDVSLPLAPEVLAAELLNPVPVRIVALRGLYRWLPDLEQVRIEPRPERVRLRRGGVYLITGGLGGIGLGMAGYLSRNYGARLALLGSTPLPPRESWAQYRDTDQIVAQRIQAIETIEATGCEVLLLTADVANPAEVDAAVRAVLGRFGVLHGVLHAAGRPAAGIMQRKTVAEAARVLAPKVQGTEALAGALRGVPLDFLLLFSSVASATGGGPGQADYCAANLFLDAWARCHATEHGATFAVSWGEWLWDAWQEGLMSMPAAGRDYYIATRQKYGFTFDEGFEVLLRVLAQNQPHLFVQNRDLNRGVQGTGHVAASLFEFLNRQSKARRYPRPELGNSFVEPRNEVESKIAQVWSEVLGIEPVGIDDNFFDLGGNSLVGIDVVARMRKGLALDRLPAMILYQAPSVRLLAEHLKQPAEVPVVDDWRARDDKRRERLRQMRHRER